ncbi:MAG: hypothetical protein A2Z71_07605 [Chloroflexi bacterium RBG_13_50_21]|nr:MAG: hypothetical protein A2Z71_07605 [Chloroflexi bacterium RBG_13_50_21]
MFMLTTLTPLHQLFQDHWDAWMRYDPFTATYVGDQRFNDRLPTATDEAIHAWREQLIGFRTRLERLNQLALPADDRLNYELFRHLVENEINELGFNAHRMPISRTAGFHLSFPDIFQVMPFEKQQDYANYIARLEAFKHYALENIELMRLGLRTGFIPPVCTLTDLDKQLKAQMVADPVESALYHPFMYFPAQISEPDRKRLSEAAQKAILRSVVPGYQAILQFVEQEYLPAARQSIASADLPDGEAFYAHRIYYNTSLHLSAQQVHQIGLDEVRRIRAEMEAVIQKTGWKGNMPDFLEFLRTDPRFYVSTPEALLEKTSYVLKRMDGELPRLFKTLPRMPYGIRPVPDYAAEGETAAYYSPGLGDGTRAGVYYVNTYDLASRPLYEIEALSLHEAVPGHHLQLALQAELAGMPMFRRYFGYNSYVEGWALYSERLGLEVGFYTDPYSDFGRLSYEMWRACRLVVDTGMHALGWSRQKAIDHLVENTSSTLLNIINEIDRYIAWPGQALAYKIGELKIRELRQRAEQKLDSKFNVREFHDVLLLSGAVPLDMLEGMVAKWIIDTVQS